MADAFQVTRDLSGRAGTATSARGAFIVLTPTPVVANPLGQFRHDVADLLAAWTPIARGAVFAQFRAEVAALLDAYTVHAGPVDALTPPAYLLEWGDPWTTPATHCYASVSLMVVCVAARIDPDPGVETLELMVADAFAALAAGGLACGESSPPRPFQVGGVTYLAARFPVRNTVNLGG